MSPIKINFLQHISELRVRGRKPRVIFMPLSYPFDPDI